MFVELPTFNTAWKNLGMSDADLHDLQNLILTKSESGRDLGGGLYKIRFSPKSLNRGKSSATRVIYVNVLRDEIIYLLTAYGKNAKSNLTDSEFKDAIQIASKL